MKTIDVLAQFCHRDYRHPDFESRFADEILLSNEPTPRDNCYCDNCFSGRDKLAVEILRLRGVIKKMAEV